MQPVDERGREVARLLAGRYEVLGLLGRGGFATVYQIRNLRLQRLEALKVVAGTHEEGSEFRQRFEQEARVAASLEHPNILKVYDFGHDQGTLWYSMPFVDGPTLKAELARRGTFDEEAAVRIAIPLLDALEYSHGRGVIHRDFKPDNVLLDRRDRPYLMDFGIAKTDDSLVKTQTGLVLGSPAYISPEQLKGERLDGRTDLYSLGVSLFQMIAGVTPFRSDRMADLADRLVNDAPRLSARAPGVAPPLDRIVGRALARSRAERYAGAREMRRDLEAFLETRRPVSAALDADAASTEDTASLRVPIAAPPIAPPPPPPAAPEPSRASSRVRSGQTAATAPAPIRVSSAPMTRIPETAPVPAPAPAPPAPRSTTRLALFGALAGAAALAAVSVVFLTRRKPPGPAPAPTPVPTAAAAAAPTAAPPALVVPPALVPTEAPPPAAVKTRPTSPPRPAAVPTTAPARIAAASEPGGVPPPLATPPPRKAPADRPVSVAPAAPTPVPVRHAKTPADVEEMASFPLTPEQERACGGKVVGVAVVVGADGSLVSRRVISPASSTCDALALEVLARSKFRAAIGDDGKPVEGRFAVSVRF